MAAQVARKVARKVVVGLSSGKKNFLLPVRGYAHLYDGPPPTDKQISFELRCSQEYYSLGIGLWNALPRLQPLGVSDLPSQAHYNARKYIGLLIATENFYAGEWKTSDMAPVIDAAHPCDIDPDTIAAAEYAVSVLNIRKRHPHLWDQGSHLWESDAILAARFDVPFNKLSNPNRKREVVDDHHEEIKLKQLIRVNGRFRGCYSVYWLTMEASDHKFYEALVLTYLDTKASKLKFVRPAKYYPEIPPHLHYLVGPTPPELPSSAS